MVRLGGTALHSEVRDDVKRLMEPETIHQGNQAVLVLGDLNGEFPSMGTDALWRDVLLTGQSDSCW